MNKRLYAENVYQQFYGKVEEASFFFAEAVQSAIDYMSADNISKLKLLDRVSHLFSAYIGACVASWEITRLSVKLHNHLLGEAELSLEKEEDLEQSLEVFSAFFGVCDAKAHGMFAFLKGVRNAAAHDGSNMLNHGGGCHLGFGSNLVRFRERRNEFEMVRVETPDVSAIEVMLDIGERLLPLFESKLKRPILDDADRAESADFYLREIKAFEFIRSLPDAISMLEKARIGIAEALDDSKREKRTVANITKDWRGMYNAYEKNYADCLAGRV